MATAAAPSPTAKRVPAIGIDLGTTYSCVGVFLQDHVEIIASEIGARTTPSYVAFSPEGCLVGQAAKNQASTNPANTIFDAKRLIGREFSDPVTQEDMKSWPFKVVEQDGKPMIEVEWQGERVRKSPEQISSLVLAKMKQMAQDYLGSPVTQAVITVPAYFNDAQRQATKDAGQLAGLQVLRIINEPTAAAIAYGLAQSDTADAPVAAGSTASNSTSSSSMYGAAEKLVLVFDLGGGTFDVSLLAIEGSYFEVKATAGDTHLGGQDFDQKMMNHLLGDFVRKNPGLPPLDPSSAAGARALRRLRTACEQLKLSLSSNTVGQVEIDAFWEGASLKARLTRARFEELCSADFARCMAPVTRVLEDARISPSRVDEIVLVGGSTRIPKVKEMLSSYFGGKAPNTSINPDEAVAYGAAVQAAILSRDAGSLAEDMLLVDVAPLSLGVETAGANMSVFIKRNATVPINVTKMYSTDADDQTAVDIKIFEGERPSTKDNHLLGTVSLEGIPKAPAGVPRIKVTFALDQDGLLSVSAVEESSKVACRISITNGAGAGRLSKEEIDKMVADAEQFRGQDRAIRRRSHARLGCLTLMQQVRVAAQQLGEYLQETELLRVLGALEDLAAWLSVNAHDASAEDFDKERTRTEKKVDAALTRAYAARVADASKEPLVLPKPQPIDASVVDHKAGGAGAGAAVTTGTTTTLAGGAGGAPAGSEAPPAVAS